MDSKTTDNVNRHIEPSIEEQFENCIVNCGDSLVNCLEQYCSCLPNLFNEIDNILFGNLNQSSERFARQTSIVANPNDFENNNEITDSKVSNDYSAESTSVTTETTTDKSSSETSLSFDIHSPSSNINSPINKFIRKKYIIEQSKLT